jgi:hypothetical protein
MKKTITLFIAICTLSLSSLRAAEIPVTTSAEFIAALTSYTAGDIILVASGDYTLSATNSIPRDLTIKASPTATTKPVVKMSLILTASVSLYIDGIEAYYDVEGAATTTGTYFIQAVAGPNFNYPTISIKNSKIHGYGRGVLRSDNGTNISTITNLIVDNCLFYDQGRNSVTYSVFGVKTAKISNASITNTTFYNSPSGIWNSENTNTAVNLLMEKCTFIKVTSTGSKLLFTASANPGSIYTIKDCIVSDSYDATATSMVFKFSADGTTTGVANLQNTIFGNHMNAAPISTTTLTTDTRIIPSTLTFNYSTLSVQTTPTAYTGIGDPRWSLSAGTLPLDFLSLTGKADALGKTVNVNWSTTNEVNTKSFEVQRKTAGSDFATIGTLASKNTAGVHNYSFTDQNAANGTAYYRILQSDNDGASKLSKVIAVSNKAASALSVYPNPAEQTLNVNHASATAGANLKVLSLEGKTIFQKAVNVNSTASNLDVSKLATGTYLLILDNNNEKSSLKFIKK